MGKITEFQSYSQLSDQEQGNVILMLAKHLQTTGIKRTWREIDQDLICENPAFLFDAEKIVVRPSLFGRFEFYY